MSRRQDTGEQAASRPWQKPGVGILVMWGLVGLSFGCAPPPDAKVAPAEPPPKKEKGPATTAYGKALEATERLKDQAQDYNDRLEKLNDPFAK